MLIKPEELQWDVSLFQSLQSGSPFAGPCSTEKMFANACIVPIILLPS
jgi:hypothetical protein